MLRGDRYPNIVIETRSQPQASLPSAPLSGRASRGHTQSLSEDEFNSLVPRHGESENAALNRADFLGDFAGRARSAANPIQSVMPMPMIGQNKRRAPANAQSGQDGNGKYVSQTQQPAAAPAMGAPSLDPRRERVMRTMALNRAVRARSVSDYAAAAPMPTDSMAQQNRVATINRYNNQADAEMFQLGAPNYFQGRDLAQSADTRANDMNRANEGLVYSEAGLNRANADAVPVTAEAYAQRSAGAASYDRARAADVTAMTPVNVGLGQQQVAIGQQQVGAMQAQAPFIPQQAQAEIDATRAGVGNVKQLQSRVQELEALLARYQNAEQRGGNSDADLINAVKGEQPKAAGAAPAAQAPAAAPVQAAAPAPAAAVSRTPIGTIADTPKGPVVWNGTDWVPQQKR
jgi:hypothetical protein